MNVKKTFTYLKGLFRAIISFKFRDLLKLMSNSPYVVEYLSKEGFSIILSVNDPAISKPILCIQQYEKNVKDQIIAHLKDETCFVDIGANLGYFTLMAATRCTQGKVICFEPDPHNYSLLKASIALNALEDRIQAYPFAVSNNSDEVYFSDLGYTNFLGSRFTAKDEQTLKERMQGKDIPLKKIRAVSLDEFLDHQAIDLIKIDIEGYEPLAFQGMIKHLSKYHPVIITEFAPGTITHISKTEPSELLHLFVNLGYTLNIIELNGNILECNNDVEKIMNYCTLQNRHHIDLLVK
ncbi:MAG: FkbM family methyltransferase [Chlamydiota bacterium]|nr:FkbM family methyltransferase [Chlamydiota bacterium]